MHTSLAYVATVITEVGRGLHSGDSVSGLESVIYVKENSRINGY